MWLQVSMVTVLCVLLDLAETIANNRDLETIFRERSDEDWGDAWHKETHSRCREHLMRHMYWACEKDIYRISRRSVPEHHREKKIPVAFPWIGAEMSLRMVRSRRSARIRGGGGPRVPPSITSECCNAVGCTWEEYAEYCPNNKRINQFV
ncbi:probable insulin-like peptide 7 [Ctenocephalides felis]|uniref:probable insulin-like peptide 7 n=1 Tax=Ctenocephalides felis TaxID=7515 RepID=UPI000E6E3ED8|nr:probable insulin-like peptide 7 [Ctenocephalides felis]XP_026469774.1 probable insulin-like peptide 7 [Ctenocephalides felis]XP_026476464.1 probable insulin-like peptide 7 [Ctenocephalides felis]